MAKEKICGIYLITSPSGRKYVGQSVDCHKRFTIYRCYCCHQQRKLYYSLKKYGHENHDFKIVEKCDESDLNAREIYWAEFYKSYDKDVGMNLRQCGGMGGKHSEESKELMRKNSWIHSEKADDILKRIASKNRGRKATDEAKMNLSISHMGYVMPESQKHKISKANKGRKPTKEHIRKIKEAHANFSPKKRKRISKLISEALMGNSHTLGQKRNKKTKAKMRKSQLLAWKKRYSEGRDKMSDATKKKMSESGRKRWAKIKAKI